MQQIIAGALDNGGTEAALARKVGMSTRHLRRLFIKHLGASPDQLARSRRAHFARRLLDDTDLSLIDVAFASGFGSVRQFNRSMQEVFGSSPAKLRVRRHGADRLAADGGLALRVPVAPDYDWDSVRAFLAAKAIPGIEAVRGDIYRRTIVLIDAPGVIEISPEKTSRGKVEYLVVRAHLPYWEGLIHIVERVASTLGTDTDHSAELPKTLVDAHELLGGYSSENGIPGPWSTFELGVWAILLANPDHTRLLEAFITRLGTPVSGLPDGLTHTFPDPQTVTDAAVASAGVPEARAIAIASFAKTKATSSSTRIDPQWWRSWVALAVSHGVRWPGGVDTKTSCGESVRS